MKYKSLGIGRQRIDEKSVHPLDSRALSEVLLFRRLRRLKSIVDEEEGEDCNEVDGS